MILHHYESSSGRDLIMEYLYSLTEEERVDGMSVMDHMENNEFDQIEFKRWEKKVYEVYFQKHNRIKKMFTYSMHVENRKIKLKRETQK